MLTFGPSENETPRYAVTFLSDARKRGAQWAEVTIDAPTMRAAVVMAARTQSLVHATYALARRVGHDANGVAFVRGARGWQPA